MQAGDVVVSREERPLHALEGGVAERRRRRSGVSRMKPALATAWYVEVVHRMLDHYEPGRRSAGTPRSGLLPGRPPLRRRRRHAGEGGGRPRAGLRPADGGALPSAENNRPPSGSRPGRCWRSQRRAVGISLAQDFEAPAHDAGLRLKKLLPPVKVLALEAADVDGGAAALVAFGEDGAHGDAGLADTRHIRPPLCRADSSLVSAFSRATRHAGDSRSSPISTYSNGSGKCSLPNIMSE